MIRNFIKGLLFGATLGGAGGLLMAPQSGKATQKQVTSYVEDLTEATSTVKDSVAHLNQAVTQTQTAVEESIPFIKTSLQKDIAAFKFQADPRMARIKEQVAQLQSDLGSQEKTETDITN